MLRLAVIIYTLAPRAPVLSAVWMNVLLCSAAPLSFCAGRVVQLDAVPPLPCPHRRVLVCVFGLAAVAMALSALPFFSVSVERDVASSQTPLHLPPGLLFYVSPT